MRQNQTKAEMELRLGFRITLVILALALSGERVEAQRAGKTIKSNIPLFAAHVDRL